MKLHGSVLLAIALVAGCTSGRFFEKPSEASLTLGTTTKAEVLERYGEPQSRLKQVQSGDDRAAPTPFEPAAQAGTWEHLGYRYENRIALIHGNELKLRAVTFKFWHDKLVAYYFISNLSEDALQLDESKIESLVKGKTTRSEVEQLLGPPSGRAVYPAIRDRGPELFSYSYIVLGTRRGGGGIHTSKRLDVLLDDQGVVQDHRFFMETR